MKALFGFFFSRGFAVFLGVTALCLLIWYVGPLVAIDRYRPLDSVTTRTICVAIIVFLYIASLVWRVVVAFRSNTQLMAGLSRPATDQSAPEDSAAAQEVAKLQKRFEEAVTVLKRSKEGKSGLRALMPGKQYLYDLPWYIFIGAPGSGKTTALVNSGIRFPLSETLGQEKIRGVGGTRNCDWWFSDEAVFLDTAGRYTTQESDREVDKSAWNGFLQLLRKYRPRRPINGAIVTISAADLLEQDKGGLEAQAAAVRARIQELHERLGIRFPVYVLVTKTDLLAGFMEFFSEYGREERAQVWGVTFPLAESDANPLPKLASELAALEQRLNDRLIERLQQERDPQKRALIYNFPQQFTVLRELLSDFLTQVFESSNFEIRPMVRGVYLTSGTQEGSPIDRIMGQLSRAFGLDNKVLPPGRPSGKAYFITRLIKDVMLAEAGIAGTNLRWERRRSVLQWAALSLAGLFVVGAIAAWSISYSRNKAYVADVQANLQSAAKQLGELKIRPNPDAVALLPALRSVRDLASTAEAPEDNEPLSMGFGLFQGDKLGSAARAAYRRLLQDALLPRLQARIEQQLRTSQQNPEGLYEALKAYIMLSEAQHFDADALKSFITFDWKANLPRDVTTEQRKELESHLTALLDQGATSSPIPPDAQLIAATRDGLARTPIAQRIYNRVKRLGIGDDLPEFSIARAAGPAGALVFTRGSGQPLTKGVPGRFSFDGYYKTFIPAGEQVAGQLASEEDWVLGLPAKDRGRLLDPLARSRLNNDVRRLYLEEYARTWEQFVADIKLVRPANLDQSIQAARVLSQPADSPLPLLVRAIVKEVTLVKTEPTEKDAIEKATDAVAKKRDDLMKLLGQQAGPGAAAGTVKLENIVDDRFDTLRRLARSAPGQPAPVDATVALIGELYTLLTATDTALKSQATPPPSDVPMKIKAEAGRLPEPLRSMLITLSQGGANQALGATRENISRAIPAQIGAFCENATAGRYPIVRSSTRDITPDDFAQVFAPGGEIDSFFQKNLAAYVDMSTKPWKFKQIGDTTIQTSSAALLQFQRAQTIRDVFFRGGRTAGLRLDFKPLEMDPTITQLILDIDGQVITYSHGPPVRTPVQWPGPRGSTQARLQFSPPLPGGTSAQIFDGPWAMFRMFDRARIDPTPQPERFNVTFTIDGRKAQFEVTTNSVQNPFRLVELEQFVCPTRL